MKIVGNPPPTPDQHRSGWLGGDVDEEAIRESWALVPDFNLVSCLPESQFAQSCQRLFPEKILQCLCGLFRLIDDTPLQSIDESFGGDIYHYDFVGLLDHPIRNGLTNTDTRNLPDLVVQAFQVLKVHRRQNVNASVEQAMNILPPLASL